MAEIVDTWEDEDGVTMVLTAGGGYYAEQDGERVALELIQPALGDRHAWLVRELTCERMKAERQAESLRAEVAFAREAGVEWEDVRRKYEADNDQLARGILELQRKLTITEKRTREAEERWEACQKRLDLDRVALRNLGEMWRQRYEREKAGRRETEVAARAADERFREETRHVTNRYLAHWKDFIEARRKVEIQLPLAYFPAGEDPEVRWGLTELGERALRTGYGLVAVAAEGLRRLAQKVNAGITEADLETCCESGRPGEICDRCAEHMVPLGEQESGDDSRRRLPGFTPPPGRSWSEFLGEEEARWRRWKEGRSPASGPAYTLPLPSYDLAAICARCGAAYQQHLDLGAQHIPCDGFLAAAEEQQTIRVKGAGLAGGAHYDPFHPRANEDGYVEDIEGRD